jgi:hypothetical protein
VTGTGRDWRGLKDPIKSKQQKASLSMIRERERGLPSLVEREPAPHSVIPIIYIYIYIIL